jgi:hypothetical protein
MAVDDVRKTLPVFMERKKQDTDAFTADLRSSLDAELEYCG